jgi:hypothetical protein
VEGPPPSSTTSPSNPTRIGRASAGGLKYPAFQDTAAELDTRIGFLLAALAESTRPTPTTPKEEQ